MQQSEDIVIRISDGALRGSRQGGVDRYLGVPYAAAPIGEGRFLNASPPAAWDDVRDATAMGPTAPQNDLSPASARYLPNVIRPGREYLNLNVWAPSSQTDCPVMVWVHGGSHKHGSNALDGYDGTAFARDGVVLVSINYRLGIEGFAVLEDGPLNVAYSDVVGALRWVQSEIRSFGGNPGAVTLFGESAGAVMVSNLLVGEHAGKLFHQVIIQSGMPTAATKRVASRPTRLLARKLGISATREAFAAVPVERMLQVERETSIGAATQYGAAIGGDFIPEDPAAAALEGRGDHVPVMAGWTSEEHTFFALGATVGPVGFFLACLRFGITPRILREYRHLHPDATRSMLLFVMAVDLTLRLPLHRIADGRRTRGARTWFYEFDWASPVDRLGATHTVELPFVFDTVASPDWQNLIGLNPPQQLADETHAAWVHFARYGTPGWREWDSSRPAMVFGAHRPSLVEGQRDAQLKAWRKREGDR